MNEVILQLLYRRLRGEILDDSAQEILDDWIDQSPENKALYEEVMNSEEFKKDIKRMMQIDSIAAWNKLRKSIPESELPKVVPFYRRYAAAIVLLVLLGAAGVYFGFVKKSADNNNDGIATKSKIIQPSELMPGSEGAILRLSDGRILDLEKMEDGVVVTQGNVVITKKNGKLEYGVSDPQAQTPVGLNMTRAPRKNRFKVALSDGTIAWLNSQSSIEYPLVFTSKERRVSITGEVYFEVAKNANKPFKVDIYAGNTKKGEVTVLGTHFNINAYDDEPSIKTTLLEGSVSITNGDETRVLKPREQAKFTREGKVDVQYLDDVDMDRTTAWHDNSFYFKNDNIETIMRQVARWYDVQIVYDSKVLPQRYNASITRDRPVKELFEILQRTGGIHFEIIEQDDTTKIIVKP